MNATRTQFAESDIGVRVHAQRRAGAPAVSAVVVDVDVVTGCPAIARLRDDGTLREECLWTGVWHSVTRAA